MGGGESKGAGGPLEGGTEEFDRQIAADAAAEHAAEEQKAAAAERSATGSTNDMYASGNLMPSTPNGVIGMVGGPTSHLGPVPTPPGTADRMIAELNGDDHLAWGIEPLQRSFGTEVEPNVLVPADAQHTKPIAAEECRTPSTIASPMPASSVGAAMAAERDSAGDAAIDAGIRADELALLADDEALMNQIVGEYGASTNSVAYGTASTGFNATSSTAASAVSSASEDLLSLTELRKEVGVAHQLMSTGELIEGLMDETTTGSDPSEMETPK